MQAPAGKFGIFYRVGMGEHSEIRLHGFTPDEDRAVREARHYAKMFAEAAVTDPNGRITYVTGQFPELRCGQTLSPATWTVDPT